MQRSENQRPNNARGPRLRPVEVKAGVSLPSWPIELVFDVFDALTSLGEAVGLIGLGPRSPPASIRTRRRHL